MKSILANTNPLWVSSILPFTALLTMATPLRTCHLQDLCVDPIVLLNLVFPVRCVAIQYGFKPAALI